MAVTRLSISVYPPIMAELEQRRDGNVSGAIGRSLERYFGILAKSRAEWRSQLSEAERALILDATNGTTFIDPVSVAMLWAEIDDACRLNSLDRKWSVDGPALVAKIRASGAIGQLALIDASERWWRQVANGEQPPYADLLADSPPGLQPSND